MADLSSLWPTITDDDGTGLTGTVIDKDLFDDIKDAIEDNIHSTTNPTIKTKTTIDEVVAARGNKSDLDTRISGVIDDDGALVTPATLVTQSALQQIIGMRQLIPNNLFTFWARGGSVAPTFWTLSGSTAARCGTGETDTKRKIGNYCVSLTNAGTLAYSLIPSADYGSANDFVEGEKISFTCWVWSSIASHSRIEIYDGDSTSTSDYHTGGSAWEQLTVTHTIGAAASELTLYLRIASNGTGYFSGPCATFSDYAPTTFLPSEVVYGTLFVPFSGTPSTGDGQFHYVFARPAMIQSIQAYVGTAPGGTDDLDIEIEKCEDVSGSTWVTSYSGTILDDTETYGHAVPSAADMEDYTFEGASSATDPALDHSVLRLNLDTVGGSVADIRIMIRCKQFVNPLHELIDYASW